MIREVATCAAVLVTAANLLGAVEWINLDSAHRLGGRMVSAGYLQGKVVLVCRDASLHGEAESVWESMKTKPFVLIGAYDKAPKDVGYPVYREAELAGVGGDSPLYLVDETGRVIFRGRDFRTATQAVVTAITDAESPRSAKQWRRFLDYELENLPAQAYNRLKSFNRQYPAEAKEYRDRARELVKIPEIVKVAEFVRFAKMAKDPRAFAAHEDGKQAKLEKIVDAAINGPKYKSLLETVKDSRMLQEVKNAFADLKWTQAGY